MSGLPAHPLGGHLLVSLRLLDACASDRAVFVRERSSNPLDSLRIALTRAALQAAARSPSSTPFLWAFLFWLWLVWFLLFAILSAGTRDGVGGRRRLSHHSHRAGAARDNA